MNPVNIQYKKKPGILGSYLRVIFSRRRGLKQGESLPEISATLKQTGIDAGHLQKYQEVCSLPGSELVPVLYPHVFASPLYMAILTHRKFPIPLTGSLHLRNHVIQHRPFTCNEVFDIEIKTGESRFTKQGLEFDFTILISRGDERIWESITTWLRKGKFGTTEDPSPYADIIEKIANAETAAESYIPRNTGKRFARITGDYNPIHMSRLMARLFGLKRDIAHAMWASADALGRLPELPGDKPQRIDLAFKGPLFLDNSSTITKKEVKDGFRFDLYCGDNARPGIQGLARQVKPGSVLF